MRSIILFLLLLTACEVAPEPTIPPVMDAVSIAEISLNGATLSSSIKTVGNQDIQEHGFLYSEKQSDADGVSTKLGSVNPTQPSPIRLQRKIASLKLNTTYFVRSFATTPEGTVYSPETSFKTLNIIQPGIRTDAADNLTHISARLKGTLTGQGTYPITQYGIVWSKETGPTTALSTKQSFSTAVTAYPTSILAEAAALSPNTKYYYRAYVVANNVTSYGAEMTFSTSSVLQPGIRTEATSGQSINTAWLSGTLLTKGSYPITEYGVVWNTAENPSTVHSKGTLRGDVTTFPSAFTVSAAGLQPNTLYYYRAYVISNGVTSYGAQLSFRTPTVVQPGVRTEATSGQSANAARLSGTLLSAGSYPIAEYGVVWNTAENPTTAHAKGTQTGNVTTFPSSFTISAGSLQPNTVYYYRAYVTSNGFTTYGAQLSFRTATVSQPGVSTGSSGGVTINSARLSGTLNSGGTYAIAEFGVCWSTGSTPTTAGPKAAEYTDVSSFPRSFTYTASGLAPATTYFYRAYVIANGAITYGATLSFRTNDPSPPNIVTVGAERGNPFKFFGRITEGGSYGVSEYGVVVSTTKREPTTADTRLQVSGTPPSYPHNFTASISNPINGAIYYYRAYVISNGVTYYGAAQLMSNGKD